jgi:hypothetical protein
MVHGGGWSGSEETTRRSSIHEALHTIVNFDDVRALARHKVLRVVFGVVDGGARGEQMMRVDRVALEQASLHGRRA